MEQIHWSQLGLATANAEVGKSLFSPCPVLSDLQATMLHFRRGHDNG